ncbi:ATP-dependent Clp protease proteolytic subunit [Rhynchospora pubera]|uniref:ATP-dependent Clp protease proteolytic subunit n=1 Tax=Rhynchospora pubera TaxID=906938 RepID=A0AAV8ASH5_9POAL|nr:ATP-dependent Clp protease proteolytic subunit [Rhynchospora pubera]
MSIGVPKVPFRRFEREKSRWIDLYQRLYYDKIVFLTREITGIIVNQIIALLLYLGKDNDDISLYINSPGGGALASLGIYDTIKSLVPNVRTIGMGLAASGASLILVGGTKSKRIAFPHTRVLIHQPSASRFVGTPRSIELEAEEMFKLRDVIADIYSENTGRPVNETRMIWKEILICPQQKPKIMVLSIA